MRLVPHRPGDEAAADTLTAGRRELLLKPTLVAVPAADQAEAAGRRHGGSEPAARYEAHWRQDDRMVQPEIAPSNECVAWRQPRRC